jgi:hypothetical protein
VCMPMQTHSFCLDACMHVIWAACYCRVENSAKQITMTSPPTHKHAQTPLLPRSWNVQQWLGCSWW